MSDCELMIWAMVNVQARWEAATDEFCICGMRYGCRVDATGLPDIGEHLRSVLHNVFISNHES